MSDIKDMSSEEVSFWKDEYNKARKNLLKIVNE